MFAKLLKHEWRATAGICGILCLAAVGVGLLAGIVLRIMTSISFIIKAPDGAHVAFALLLVFLMLALIGCIFACYIMLLVRFYKSKFTDEGYLTFTLPVSSRDIFLSSMTNMSLWVLITDVVTILSLFLMILIGAPFDQLQGEVFDVVEVMGVEVNPLLAIVQFLVSLAYTPTIAITCLTLGAVMAKKHKIILAFAMYYVITMIMSTLSAMIMYIPLSLDPGLLFNGLDLVTGIQLLLQAALTVGGYFLSTHLMKKKLNLP